MGMWIAVGLYRETLIGGVKEPPSPEQRTFSGGGSS
jgi:hypothetical protein